MRNLKRALSLTLASVMLLGMMVIGSSAAQGFPDVDDNDNVEAIEVLQAVAVMVGDAETGNFRPDAPVNRAEMAVVMGLLLNLDYNYYESTCPFADVSGSYAWARGWVGACAANGIIAGRSTTVYDPGATVTAVEAASMMMRALGYFKFPSDYKGDFLLSTVTQASKIRLFDQINANATDPLTRNQVAQLALNTLKTPIVEPEDNTFEITSTTGNTSVTASGGQVNYVVTTSSKDFAYSIGKEENSGIGLNQVQGGIIELGEQLYNGKLKLNEDARDEFDRPSRYWEYDGRAIGTYAKYEILREEYTAEVTGRELYDMLGGDIVTRIERGEYSLRVAIDGIDDASIDEAVFNVSAINRNNKAGVGATGNGVLTQVFVDGDKKIVYIDIINTYLAIADQDYDEKKETVDLNVYGLEQDGNKNLLKSITKDEDTLLLKVSSEDFAVEDVVKGDSFLVNVADGEIQIMRAVEPMAAVEISSFQARQHAVRGSGNLTTGGQKYDFSDTAEYENACLKIYTDGDQINLKDVTYNVFLDRYGYVIGVVEVDKPVNYVFITGVNSGDNNLAEVTLEANAIFLDGDMKTITIDRKNSPTFVKALAGTKADNSTFNKWCSYSVGSSGVYTLKLVDEDVISGVGQTVGARQLSEINNKHLDVEIKNTTPAFVYGNNKSVYLSVAVEETQTTTGRTDCIITAVDSATVGIDNVDIVPLYGSDARAAADDTDESADTFSQGIYTLYDGGWIIGMVVVGDDNGKNSKLVYVHNESVAQEYNMGDDGYKWERTVIIDGKEETLTEVNETRLSLLQQMGPNNWYRVKTDVNENVTAIDGAYDHAIDDDDGVEDDNPLYNEDKDKIGNWGFTLTTRTAYVKAYADIVTALRNDSVDTILYHEKFVDKVPSADKQTIYVTTGANSGIRFAEDVRIVLDQVNDNKRETEYGTGESQLKSFLKNLHKNENGNYNYEISAVIEGPYATSIVIKDLVEDGDSGSGGGGGGGAKVAIVGADTMTTGKTIKIGYMSTSDRPKNVDDIQAIVEAWAKEAGYTLGERTAASGGYKWNCYDVFGTVVGDVALNTTTGIVPGIRVQFVDESGTITGYGWEILNNTNPGASGFAASYSVQSNSDGDVTAAWIKNHNDTDGFYIAARAKSTGNWTWSEAAASASAAPAAVTEAGVVEITGNDWQVFLSTYQVKYKVLPAGAAETSISWTYGDGKLINASGGVYASAADFTADYPGTTIAVTAEETAPVAGDWKAPSGTETIADGKVVRTGYVQIPNDAGSTDTVTLEINGQNYTTVETGGAFVVPIKTSVKIHIAFNSSVKTFRATGSTVADITTVDSTGGDGTIVTGTANVTFGALSAIDKTTFGGITAANDEDVDAFNVKWYLSTDGGASWTAIDGTADVKVNNNAGSTEKIKAVVTFADAYTDQGTSPGDAGDELAASGTGVEMRPNISDGAAAIKDSKTVTLNKAGVSAGNTTSIEFIWGATELSASNLKITLTKKD